MQMTKLSINKTTRTSFQCCRTTFSLCSITTIPFVFILCWYLCIKCLCRLRDKKRHIYKSIQLRIFSCGNLLYPWASDVMSLTQKSAQVPVWTYAPSDAYMPNDTIGMQCRGRRILQLKNWLAESVSTLALRKMSGGICRLNFYRSYPPPVGPSAMYTDVACNRISSLILYVLYNMKLSSCEVSCIGLRYSV